MYCNYDKWFYRNCYKYNTSKEIIIYFFTFTDDDTNHSDLYTFVLDQTEIFTNLSNKLYTVIN